MATRGLATTMATTILGFGVTSQKKRLNIKGPFIQTEAVNWGQKYCKQYWWTNLLYINNFIPGGMNEMVMNVMKHVSKETK